MPTLPPPSQIWTALLFALAVAFFSRRLRILTVGGSVAQFFLGWVLLSFGGWQWTFPVLVFFVSSSAISLFRREERSLPESFFAKTGSRDAWQVFANGGVAGACAVGWFFSSLDGLYVASLGALAAATADTWATEIGVVSHGKPRLITNFRQVAAGTSGAVSLPGTAAALGGAALLATSGLPWIPEIAKTETVLSVAVAGLAGSLVDSFLGAALQARFRCASCGKISERSSHCSIPAVRIYGLSFVNNDAVNLLCTISGGSFSLLLLRFLPF